MDAWTICKYAATMVHMHINSILSLNDEHQKGFREWTEGIKEREGERKTPMKQ